MKTNLAGLDRKEIADALGELDVKRFVPRQLYRWIYLKRAVSFEQMTDLGVNLRSKLEEGFEVRFPEVGERQKATDGTTRYVFQLEDGERVESVLIPGKDHQATLCVSSQVGCPLACTFCVSGLEGVKRNLTVGEIVGQARAMLLDAGELRRTNVVFMGMGEALLNFDNLVPAIDILTNEEGLRIAMARMTVSTAGHVTSMKRFGKLPRRPRLAVSLNASTDAQRDQIMPINKTWPIKALLDACRSFPLGNSERITFEYVLLGGFNDALEDADRIAKLLEGIPSKVNLIPWNATPGLPFESPASATVDAFAERLHRRHVLATVRRRRGADAGAACGQLAMRRSPEVKTGA